MRMQIEGARVRSLHRTTTVHAQRMHNRNGRWRHLLPRIVPSLGRPAVVNRTAASGRRLRHLHTVMSPRDGALVGPNPIDRVGAGATGTTPRRVQAIRVDRVRALTSAALPVRNST